LKIISYIYTKDKEGFKKNLYEYFRESVLWKDMELWNDSYHHLLTDKKETESARGQGKFWSWGTKVVGKIAQTLKNEQSNTPQDDLFNKCSTMEVVTFFMGNLNMEVTMSTEILKHLAVENSIPQNFYVSLSDKLENAYHTSTMKKLNYCKKERNERRLNLWG
jgi:phosphopantetheinyl transferase (holo-ACP synthase)